MKGNVVIFHGKFSVKHCNFSKSDYNNCIALAANPVRRLERGNTTMMHERRQRRRIRFARPIRVTTPEGERLSLMAQDFSMEGLGFKTTTPRDIGEILRVAVNIGHNGRSHIMNALGEVVHRRYKDKVFYIGMRFFKDQSKQ
jgi:PilZ domain